MPLGALLLAGEAAVHIQQYIAIFYAVSWIGPLFLANAAACIAAIDSFSSARMTNSKQRLRAGEQRAYGSPTGQLGGHL